MQMSLCLKAWGNSELRKRGIERNGMISPNFLHVVSVQHRERTLWIWMSPTGCCSEHLALDFETVWKAVLVTFRAFSHWRSLKLHSPGSGSFPCFLMRCHVGAFHHNLWSTWAESGPQPCTISRAHPHSWAKLSLPNPHGHSPVPPPPPTELCFLKLPSDFVTETQK